MASKITVPTLFVTTEIDNYVPSAMTREIYKEVSANKRLHVYPSGDHGQAYSAQPERFTEDIRRFLVDMT